MVDAIRSEPIELQIDEGETESPWKELGRGKWNVDITSVTAGWVGITVGMQIRDPARPNEVPSDRDHTDTVHLAATNSCSFVVTSGGADRQYRFTTSAAAPKDFHIRISQVPD